MQTILVQDLKLIILHSGDDRAGNSVPILIEGKWSENGGEISYVGLRLLD